MQLTFVKMEVPDGVDWAASLVAAACNCTPSDSRVRFQTSKHFVSSYRQYAGSCSRFCDGCHYSCTSNYGVYFVVVEPPFATPTTFFFGCFCLYQSSISYCIFLHWLLYFFCSLFIFGTITFQIPLFLHVWSLCFTLYVRNVSVDISVSACDHAESTSSSDLPTIAADSSSAASDSCDGSANAAAVSRWCSSVTPEIASDLQRDVRNHDKQWSRYCHHSSDFVTNCNTIDQFTILFQTLK